MKFVLTLWFVVVWKVSTTVQSDPDGTSFGRLDVVAEILDSICMREYKVMGGTDHIKVGKPDLG